MGGEDGNGVSLSPHHTLQSPHAYPVSLHTMYNTSTGSVITLSE